MKTFDDILKNIKPPQPLILGALYRVFAPNPAEPYHFLHNEIYRIIDYTNNDNPLRPIVRARNIRNGRYGFLTISPDFRRCMQHINEL